MIKEEGLQDISRALTHMLFRNVPLVEEIHTKQLVIDQETFKISHYVSHYGHHINV